MGMDSGTIGKQIAAVRREYQQAKADGDLYLAARILLANPDVFEDDVNMVTEAGEPAEREPQC